MFDIFLISIGAILGSNIRFKIYNELENLKLSKDLYAFLINTSASFILGFFISMIEKSDTFIYSYQIVLCLSIGLLGSLSTFSSFVYDLFDLCLQFKFSRAIKLLMISLSFGVFAFMFGFLLGN